MSIYRRYWSRFVMSEKKTNYLPALRKGKESLVEVWNNEAEKTQLPKLCGCRIDAERIMLQYFGTEYSVSMPGCEVSPEGLKVSEQILLFHYLTRPLSPDAAPAAESTSWITFKQLPNAEFYNPTYQKRGPKIILSAFAENPGQLISAGERMGGRKGDFGDYSVVLHPLPKIDAMAVFYAGDDELPPAAEILFSADIHRFLPLEDTAVFAGFIAGRLIKASRGGM